MSIEKEVFVGRITFADGGRNKFPIDKSRGTKLHTAVVPYQSGEGDLSKLIHQATELQIVDAESEAKATQLLGAIKKEIKTADDAKDRILKPMNESRASVLSQWHQIVDPLKGCLEFLGGGMGKYCAEEERKRNALQAIADAEHNRKIDEHRKAALKSSDENVTAVAPPVPVIIEQKSKQVKTAGTTVSMVNTLLNDNIRILDVEKVPRELCVPDMKLIRKRIESGIGAIPGVQWEYVLRPKVRV